MAYLNGPQIVRDGLVLYLDAGNRRSYPGSGTSWTDLSGNGNNGTLTNGPTFDSGNGGSIVFDSVDDHVSTGTNLSTIASNLFADGTGTWTVSTWFKFPISPAGTRTGNASWMIVGRGGGIATAATFAIFVGSATDTGFGAYAPYKVACVVRGNVTIISPSSVNDNIWHNTYVTWNGSSGAVYWDGEYISAVNVGTAALQTNNLFVGNQGTGTTHTFNGSISNVSIYNKALTATEVLQNFNATRSRFGV
jgi:hypothetical protein